MIVHIGCSGFHYAHWKGLFYPETLASASWLEFYSHHFDTVEINASFYRFPAEHTVQFWETTAATVNNDFVFTLKGNRLITHLKRLHLTPESENAISRFVSLFDIFQKNRGCILWQLHKSMKYNEKNCQILDDFCHYLARIPRRFVIEFRDSDWWNEKTFQILQNSHIAFCVESGLGLPDSMVATTEFAYIRFHGPSDSYSSNYTDVQLIEWKNKIMKYCTTCNELYCYFNNDVNAYAVANAMRFRELMGAPHPLGPPLH